MSDEVENETENKLRTEINYLRRLIDAHKAIQDLQSNSGEKEPCNQIKGQSCKQLQKKRSFIAGTSWYNSGSIICHSQQKQTVKRTKTCEDHSASCSSSSIVNSVTAVSVDNTEPSIHSTSTFDRRNKVESDGIVVGSSRYRKRKLVSVKGNTDTNVRRKDLSTPSVTAACTSSITKRRRKSSSNLDSSMYSQGRPSPLLKRKFQYQFKDSPIITRYSLRKRKKLIIKDSSGGNIDTGATAASNFMKRNGSSSQSELPFAFKSVVRKRKRSYKYINGAQYLSFTNGRSLKRIKNSQGTPKNFESKFTYSRSKAQYSKSTTSMYKSSNKTWSCKTKKATDTKQYCIFYNRFGHCNRGDKCPFIHDSKRVAVCNKFLRGLCNKLDGSCPFSHNVSKEKMPVCAFFLQGLCTRENCPYLHVNLGSDTEVCQDFLKGFCPLAEKCKKRHDFRCLEFMKNGFCSKGNQCVLLHSKKRLQTKLSHHMTPSKPVLSIKEPYFFKKMKMKKQRVYIDNDITSPTQLITPVQLEYIPLQTSTESDFIPL